MENDSQTLRSLLSQTRFGENLAAPDLESIAGVGRLLDVPSGKVLFSEGALEDEVFVVVEGHVALEMLVPRRGNVRLLTVGPGELVGWSGLLGDGPMTATALTTDAATLIGLSSRKLRELCQQNHELGYVLMTQTAKAIAQRVLVTRLQLLDLFAETEPQTRPGRSSS